MLFSGENLLIGIIKVTLSSINATYVSDYYLVKVKKIWRDDLNCISSFGFQYSII